MEKQRWLEKCKEEMQVPMAQHDCGTGVTSSREMAKSSQSSFLQTLGVLGA